MQLFLLTSLTMIAFAANSVFARLALGSGAVDAASYSAVRLGAGALVLGLLAANVLRAQSGSGWPDGLQTKKGVLAKDILASGGNLLSAFALLVYVVGFSYAYLALDTGMGALILFTCVQATMIGWGMVKGNRPSPLEWIGLAIAFSAFTYLVSPGLTAPDPIGTVLMIAAGVGWGAYSLRGRGAASPLLDTAGNFIRATVMVAVVVVAVAIWRNEGSALHISGQGFWLAAASGALTSGLGYALWYRCLRQLTPTKASIVQLSVPAIATLGGVMFAGEVLSLRLIVCSVLILGGVAVAISAKAKAV